MKSEGLFVVTGGSRGIGAATARLAAASHPVVVLYRREADRAERLAHEINARGGQVHALQCDLADEASLLAAFEQVDRLGRLEVLVNNAGITGGISRVEDLSASILDEVFSVNVRGLLLACREGVRRMSTHRGGTGGAIVNVSSAASVTGTPNAWIHYAATKGAVDTATVGLAKEVAREGIRVNAVRPGLINTELHLQRPAGQLAQMVTSVPFGRLGTAEEIAEAIVWLASPAASYVSGCLLDAHGCL